LDDAAELATLGIDIKESGLVNWLNDKPRGEREKKGPLTHEKKTIHEGTRNYSN